MSTYLLRTLFVQTEGTRLLLEGDAVKAVRDDAPSRRLPLNAIDSIVVLSGVDVSTPLLTRCGEDGRTVAFLSRFGKPRAIVEGALSGRGRLRVLQHQRRLDIGARAEASCAIVRGKLRQLAWGLRQWARDIDAAKSELLRHSASDIESMQAGLMGATRESALGIEGAASRRYFEGMAVALRYQSFEGRLRRPPMDIVNAALSLAYGLSRVAVHGALHSAGLDPYCGFLHGDRDGQPSLVLDMLEEFRPEADRLAVSLFNRRKLRPEHFRTQVGGAVEFTEEGSAILLDAWHQQRNRMVSVIGFAEPMSYASVAITQANLLANALRTGRAYVPHRMEVQ